MSDLCDKVKSGNFGIFESNSDIDISEDCFSMDPPGGQGQAEDIRRIMTLKQFLILCLGHEDKDLFTVPVDSIEMGTAEQCMTLLNNTERIHSEEEFKRALCIKNGTHYSETENAFGDKGIIILDAGFIKSFVVRIPKSKHKCRINGSVRKSMKFANTIASLELGENPPGLPGVSELKKRGEKELENIKDQLEYLENDPDTSPATIDYMKQKLAYAKDTSTWLGMEIHLQNFPFFQCNIRQDICPKSKETHKRCGCIEAY